MSKKATSSLSLANRPRVGLNLLPLGGMGKVTQNMFLYEIADEILIIDMGIGFPDSYMPGVDVLIPDIKPLLKKLEAGKRIVGMILTHGHDDHVGALGYILPHLPEFPIYGSALTIGFAAEKLKEFKLKAKMQVVGEKEEFSVGGSKHFRAVGYHVTHSIPDTRHYLVKTSAGTFYHGTDFKLDPTPVDLKPTDLESISQLKGQVDLMLVDCLGVEKDEPIPSESTVGAEIERIMQQTKGKLVVTLMSSHIHRIQQIVDAAERHGRKVVFVGRSVEKNVRVAQELSELILPKGIVVSKKKIDDYRDSQLVIIIAGSQGQEGSSLMRAVFGEHHVVHLGPQDTVVFSASVIPGNEYNYYGAIDELSRNKIYVLYPAINPKLHRSGHGSQPEQVKLLDLIKPRFVMPIGGADRHREKFAELVAKPLGYKDEQILLPSPGEELNYFNDRVKVVSATTLKPQIVDGLGIGDVGPAVLSDRRSLSQAGIVVVVLPRRGGQILKDKIEVISRGFVFMKEAGEVVDFIISEAVQVLAEHEGRKHDEIRRRIEKRLARKLYKVIKREPMIVVSLIDV